MLDVSAVRKQLRETGEYMMRFQLAWGNAGNISARLGEEACLVSASGSYLGELTEDDLVEARFTDGDVPAAVFPGRKPSKEMPMHRAIYEARPDIQAVLHASPFYTTLVACSNIPLPSELFVESMYYLERVEKVPYKHPGSAELGAAVREKAQQANILLLENHGVLVYDTSIREALMALQTMEMACRMVVETMASGISLEHLPAVTVAEFLEHSGYRPRRKWRE